MEMYSNATEALSCSQPQQTIAVEEIPGRLRGLCSELENVATRLESIQERTTGPNPKNVTNCAPGVCAHPQPLSCGACGDSISLIMRAQDVVAHMRDTLDRF